MGKYDKISAELQREFFREMISGFHCINTWQGFIYFIIGFGQYLAFTYYIVDGNKYCTGETCVEKVSKSELLTSICSLRNNLVHFKPIKALNDIETIQNNLDGSAFDDPVVNAALDALRASDISLLTNHIKRFM